jgi:hypothetical protein
MKVTVVKRDSSKDIVSTPAIEINDNCPVCGKPRGKPSGYNFWEDGSWHWCNIWNNPCGHIDYYADVIKEAEALKVTEAISESGTKD